MLRKTELQKVSRAIAIDRLMDELKRHAGAPNPVCSFFFWNRSRREVSLSPYRIFNRFKSVYSPFTDIALTQHLSSLPSGMVIDHTFHNDTIARAFPRHAHIPYAKKPGFPRMNLKAFRQFARDVGRFSIENGISSIISYSWLFPRLVRCFLDKQYSPSILWIGPCTMYFLHLERIRRAADKGLLSR
jgi:asparagine synthase (glutamine-hydrolysing)